MKKARGSALVIAVLLIAAIGAIAFTFGKIVLVESANASLYENGTFAYYAAESGMEEGFLRYRYDRNAEVPLNGWTLDSAGNNKVFRTNLSDSTINTNSDWGLIKTLATDLTLGKQSYDLRMGFIGTSGLPFYGQDTALPSGRLSTADLDNASYGTGANSTFSVAKDNSLKIDLSNLDFTSNNIGLFARYTPFNGSVPAGNNSVMEVKLTVDMLGNGTDVREFKTILSNDSASDQRSVCALLGKTTVADQDVCMAELIQGSYYSNTLGVINIITQMRLSAGVPSFLSSAKVSLYLKPLMHNALIGLTSNNCASGLIAPCDGTKNTVIAGPYSTVTATGYYGGVTRTMQANIDRQSGTLYDLFDYVIYKTS